MRALRVCGALLVALTGCGDRDHVRRAPIGYYEKLGPRTLRVVGWGDPCTELEHVEVDENQTQVLITVWVRRDPEKVCIQIVKELPATVHLDEALGTRAVIDATTGQRPTQRP